MRAPRVSVVLAVHNGKPYLEAALQSILRQSLHDLELVVVNDGSTDGSRDVVLAAGDARIRLLDNARNLGLTPSLNRALSEARGDFIARIDADDLAMPDRLARQAGFLSAHPDVGLVGSWYRTIDGADRTLRRDTPPSDHVALRWHALFHCPFVHSSVMWRREAVSAAVGAYDEQYRYAMDWEFWARIASRLRIAGVRRTLAAYRVQPQSMTATHPRVEEETGMARQAALRYTLGDAADAFLASPLGPALYAPADGWPRTVTDDDIAASLDAVRRLSTAFAERLALNGARRQVHEAHVRRWLGRLLLSQARRSLGAGLASQARALFRAARDTDPLAPFSVKGLRYLAARWRVG